MLRVKADRSDLVHRGVRVRLSTNDERFLIATLLRQLLTRYELEDDKLNSYFNLVEETGEGETPSAYPPASDAQAGDADSVP